MNIYVIVSNYFDSGMFGTYSTILRARKVLELFFNEDPNIMSFEDVGDYCYQFITTNGAQFSAEICCDYLDAEYESGMIKEDE